MILSLAWKNIWRNKTRSLILIIAAALGLWGGVFTIALMNGMWEAMINNYIDRNTGHIQIHAKDFLKEKNLNNYIAEGEKILSQLQTEKEITGVSARVIIDGLVSSPHASGGIKIVGINLTDEMKVTTISKALKEGKFFSEANDQVVIGKKLAEMLKVKLRSKIVLSFQGLDGTIIYAALRVVGIFETESSTSDRLQLFVKKEDIFKLLNTKPIYHEIAIRAVNGETADLILPKLNNQFANYDVDSWLELSPMFKYGEASFDIQLYFFIGIILFGLLFGIINTMLMSVLDRVREFGVLLAVGMKRIKLFRLIMLESLILSIFGALIGVALGYVTILLVSKVGVDLSLFSAGLAYYGINTVLCPVMPKEAFYIISLMIIITAVIASLYPAFKAIKLQPAVAIRTF